MRCEFPGAGRDAGGRERTGKMEYAEGGRREARKEGRGEGVAGRCSDGGWEEWCARRRLDEAYDRWNELDPRAIEDYGG